MADKVLVIATGGTIASHLTDGVWVSLPGAVLVNELGQLDVDVEVVDVATGSSSNLSAVDMVRIAERITHATVSGFAGVVVTHGTDTLELTSFLCSLLVDTTKCAVVFTGAMRPHSSTEVDGPQNLRDAISLAAATSTRQRGVVVVLNGTVHSPRHIRKVNAVDIEAFSSYPVAPIGAMVDGTPRWIENSTAANASLPAPVDIEYRVPLVVSYPGIDAKVLEAACSNARGVVVEAFGELNSPENLWPVIRAASDAGILVALTSNSYTPTVTNEGLTLLGARGMGGLTSQKARLAMMCALGDNRSVDEANSYLDSIMGAHS